jgi:hypothetical protein
MTTEQPETEDDVLAPCLRCDGEGAAGFIAIDDEAGTITCLICGLGPEGE